MSMPSKKPSTHNSKEIFLSKKHIITQEQLSQLCSQSKQSRSSNLLQLVTRTKHKLNTLSKRTNQPDTFVTTLNKPQQPHHKSTKQTKQNNNFQQQQQMNNLYEQNQKLGYRINYLNDQNNFFRISINNIQKLNNNIHKQLDGHDVGTGVKNKIDTKTGTTTNNTLSNGKTLSTHATAHPFAGGMRRYLTKIGSLVQVQVSTSNPTQAHKQSSTTLANQQLGIQTTGISSSFSQISNKIHLKNLQMKVGNSIRKTQKLKKIYQGSISALTKKSQQLQAQVNKLSRQAEYYSIESQLLNNIYKADYYLHLNEEWLEVAGCQLQDNAYKNTMAKNHLDSLKELSDEENYLINNENNDSDDDYVQYLKKDSQMMTKLKKKPAKKFSAQQTIISHKMTSIHNSNNNYTQEFRPSKGIQTLALNHNKKNTLTKQMTAQTFPMAIRFMSGSYNHSRLGNSFKNTWYSALYNTKTKNNKLSQLMAVHNTNHMPQNSRGKHIAHNTNQGNNHSFMQYNSNNLNNDYAHDGLSNDSPEQKKHHMTEKELFLLPHDMISLIISSLEKQEIQQVNKLESLRKQEREQRKTNFELIESIEKFTTHKEKLKALIEQEFQLFFLNNVNTMETISSFNNNNNTVKKASASSSGNNASNGGKLAFGHTKAKSRTLHRQPSNLKLPQSTQSSSINAPTKPTPWISIQQRKQQADQLYLCSLYQKQLLQSIQKQDKLLEEQYKINQQYKQKIVDRNEQENKELKVLEEEVNKCMEQVKEIKFKYKSICQAKGKHIGSHSSVASSGNVVPMKGNKDGLYKQA